MQLIEAQRATSTIPIVSVSVADPVGSGFAVNLAHPGHNLTGVTKGNSDAQTYRSPLPSKIQ